MVDGSQIHVLVATQLTSLVQFRDNLSKDPQLKLAFVASQNDAREVLADPHKRTDVFIIDNALGGVFELIRESRQTYPRLLIILVDQEADFGTPGHADEVSVTPFENDDLLKRIKRLTEERSLETLRTDALPPVRAFAKSLRRAGPGTSKTQAAVEAIKELGYDYVAFYSIVSTSPPELKLGAQMGPDVLTSIAPQQQDLYDTLAGWVAQNGHSRIIGPEDHPNHPFIQQHRVQSGVCVPVGTTLRFGVILACREQPNAITQQNVMVLELVSAQLANALARQTRS
jgi:GAF domain-containing protein